MRKREKGKRVGTAHMGVTRETECIMKNVPLKDPEFAEPLIKAVDDQVFARSQQKAKEYGVIIHKKKPAAYFAALHFRFTISGRREEDVEGAIKELHAMVDNVRHEFRIRRE